MGQSSNMSRNRFCWAKTKPGLVFYCCVANYHKFGSLKQHAFIFSQFLNIGSLGTEQLSSLLQSHRIAFKVSARLPSYLELGVLFQAHSYYRQILFPCKYMLKLSLARFAMELFSATRDCPQSLLHGPILSQHGSWLLGGQHENLSHSEFLPSEKAGSLLKSYLLMSSPPKVVSFLIASK